MTEKNSSETSRERISQPNLNHDDSQRSLIQVVSKDLNDISSDLDTTKIDVIRLQKSDIWYQERPLVSGIEVSIYLPSQDHLIEKSDELLVEGGNFDVVQDFFLKHKNDRDLLNFYRDQPFMLEQLESNPIPDEKVYYSGNTILKGEGMWEGKGEDVRIIKIYFSLPSVEMIQEYPGKIIQIKRIERDLSGYWGGYEHLIPLKGNKLFKYVVARIKKRFKNINFWLNGFYKFNLCRDIRDKYSKGILSLEATEEEIWMNTTFRELSVTARYEKETRLL